MGENYQAMLQLVKAALKEDIGKGDITSLACLEPNPVKAKIVAKSSGILSGLKPTLLVFDVVDSANGIKLLKDDADRFEPGDTIVEIDGFNLTVLSSERVALNFMAHLSGIASLTDRFVQLIDGTACRILDTRKTTPGWRMLEKEAVTHGGGVNHRIGLYDMILIKDNHIAAAGSITKAVEMTREYLNTPEFRLQFEKKSDEIEVEVEVTTEDELTEAISAGVDRLLLDNQGLDALAQLVQRARSLNANVKLEASGNVSLGTAADIATTGVDFISIGALTHSAPASDFSLKVIA